MAEQALACAIVGSPASVEEGIRKLLRRTQADELIFASHIYDHKARLRSYQIAAEVGRRMDIGVSAVNQASP